MDDSSPEVTISPADNGHVVRWHQRGSKKDEPGRTIKRVAMSSDDALGHAAEALGGSGKASKKKTTRSVGHASSAIGADASDAGEAGSSSPAAHSSHSMRSRSMRRRPVRSRRRA